MMTAVVLPVADGFELFHKSTSLSDSIPSSTDEGPPVISKTLPLRLLLLPENLEYGRLEGRRNLRNSMMTVVLPPVAEG